MKKEEAFLANYGHKEIITQFERISSHLGVRERGGGGGRGERARANLNLFDLWMVIWVVPRHANRSQSAPDIRVHLYMHISSLSVTNCTFHLLKVNKRKRQTQIEALWKIFLQHIHTHTKTGKRVVVVVVVVSVRMFCSQSVWRIKSLRLCL